MCASAAHAPSPCFRRGSALSQGWRELAWSCPTLLGTLLARCGGSGLVPGPQRVVGTLILRWCNTVDSMEGLECVGGTVQRELSCG